jgi:hypothetical protein
MNGQAGRRLLLFFCGLLSLLSVGATLCSATQASLRVYNDRGVIAHEIAAEQPFRVELCVPGDTGKHGWPQIPRLPIDSIMGRQQRHELSWNQGKQSGVLCFLWEVVMRTPGSYELGPIRYTMDDGTTIDIPSVTIKIVEARNAPAQAHKSLSFMRWEVTRLDPFVGESVPLKLVFYTTDEVQLEAISEIKSDKAIIELPSQATWGTATHNGISYTTVSWEGTVQIASPGTFSLPAIGMVYKKTQKSAASPWAIMQHMLGAFSPSQQLRSSPLSLNVRALPASEKQSIGVGIIEQAERILSASEISEGGAVTVTYRLTGSINFAHSRFPSCVCEGEEVTTYGQKAKVSGAYPSYTGEQEYVVHVQRTGSVLFPREELWFFNPYTERYESVTIPEASLNVIPREHHEEHVDNTTKDLKNSQATEQEGVARESRETSQSMNMLQGLLRPQLPFRWFILLLLLPIMLMLLRGVGEGMVRTIYCRVRLALLVWQTKRSFIRAARAHDGYQIHSILCYFVYQLGWVAKGGTLGDTVYHSFEDVTSSQVLAQEWKLFWSLVERAAFAYVTPAEYGELERVGTLWIDRLLGLLNTRC